MSQKSKTSSIKSRPRSSTSEPSKKSSTQSAKATDLKIGEIEVKTKGKRGRNEIEPSGKVASDPSKVSGGVVHALPDDFRDALLHSEDALAAWEDITPLARNEFICWVEAAKKPETRVKRITWGCDSLKSGKRRPCCWQGCVHR